MSLSNPLSMFDVKGKVALITGGARTKGQGAAEGRLFASRGATVVLTDVLDEEGERTAGEIENAEYAHLDVASESEWDAVLADVVARHGRLDVVVNNAGIARMGQLVNTTLDDWNLTLAINQTGVFLGMKYGTAAIRKTGGPGSVVNLSSIYSNFPVVGAGVYGATKAAVNFLSDSLRVESQGRIKVTVVKPTGVPATGLGAGIINPAAVIGILGQNAPSYMQLREALQNSELPIENTDVNSIEYYALEPEYLADQIIAVINQPWGVNISEITVRASGDAYIL